MTTAARIALPRKPDTRIVQQKQILRVDEATRRPTAEPEGRQQRKKLK